MNLIPLLLADPSPSLRLLVLRELLQRPENDPEVQEIKQLQLEDPLVNNFLISQNEDGSWDGTKVRDSTYADKINVTSIVLSKLGFLGLTPNHFSIKKGVEFLFSQQKHDGSWPISSGRMKAIDGGYSMIPLQTAFPLKGIAYCGYSTDERAERAYHWLLERQLDDGAWPAGEKSGTRGGIAGYRKIPHSRWGCRSNTTAVLTVLALHPKFRIHKSAKRALDLLLGRETKERHALGFEVARLIGIEPCQGYFTHYAKFDVGLILNLCWRIEASKEDERIADIIDFITTNQGEYGLWDYIPHPHATRWVTFDLLRSLSKLENSNDWFSLEPRTPFKPYPKHQKRF
jgi:hypothetical protein